MNIFKMITYYTYPPNNLSNVHILKQHIILFITVSLFHHLFCLPSAVKTVCTIITHFGIKSSRNFMFPLLSVNATRSVCHNCGEIHDIFSWESKKVVAIKLKLSANTETESFYTLYHCTISLSVIYYLHNRTIVWSLNVQICFLR